MFPKTKEFPILYNYNSDIWRDWVNCSWWRQRNNDTKLVREFYDYSCEMPTGRVGVLSDDENTVLLEHND